MTTRSPRKAFTLIELLVVISIIALLVSILLPALGRARKQAKATLCASNQHGLATAIAIYHADNKGFFWPSAGSNDYFWQRALRKYYDNVDDIRFCPEAKVYANLGASHDQHPWGAKFHCWGSGEDTSMIGDDQGSYAMNAWLDSFNTDPKNSNEELRNQMYMDEGGSQTYWQRVGKCNQPATIPMLMDSTVYSSKPSNNAVAADTPGRGSVPPYDGPALNFDEVFYTWVSQAGWGQRTVTINRHALANNICFVDTHVERIPLWEYWLQKWNRQSTPANFDLMNDIVRPAFDGWGIN